MKKRNFVFLKRILTRLFIIFLIIGGLYLYLRTSFFTINTYEFVGIPDKYKTELTEQLKNISSRRLFYLFPGNRIISFHRSDIKDLIYKTLPNTSIISLYPYGLHKLKVVVVPYVPLFRINDKQAITKDAIIYNEINSLFELPKLEISSSTNITTTTLSSITKIIPELNAVLYPIKNITIDNYGDIRLYDNEMKHAVIVLSNADMNIVWSNLISAIDTEPLKSKLKNSKESLEYLDTRFDNKVFYKFTPLDKKNKISNSTSTIE